MLLKGQDVIDDGAHVPVGDHRGQEGNGFGESFGLLGQHAPRAAADIDVAQQKPVDRNPRDSPRGDAHHHLAPLGPQATQGRREAIAADGVKGDVDELSANQTTTS